MEPKLEPRHVRHITGPYLCLLGFGFGRQYLGSSGNFLDQTVYYICKEESDYFSILHLLCYHLTLRDLHSLSGSMWLFPGPFFFPTLHSPPPWCESFIKVDGNQMLRHTEKYGLSTHWMQRLQWQKRSHEQRGAPFLTPHDSGREEC